MNEGLKAGREGDNREWDDWMASPTWCTWVWASSCSWWWTGRPIVLQSMGLQRIGHNWVSELNWTDYEYTWSFNQILNITNLHFLIEVDVQYCVSYRCII